MILILNCGSQSVKWKMFDLPRPLRRIEASGKAGKNLKPIGAGSQIEELGKIKESVSLIGHRVVHGGSFAKPIKITQEVLAKLEKFSALAPLHNPYNISGIKACQKIFPKADNIAVFDTEFFSDLPACASVYALPEDIIKQFGFKRYGFHGISHEYAASQAAKIIKKPLNKIKIITCHLGGGSSITAVKNGKAIDTSMGFTPLDGLVMMTRPGSIDPGIVLELAKSFSLEKINEVLNKESGLKGICGKAGMLEILEAIKAGDKRAKLALDVFAYSVKKYIGSYYAVLGGCDALVFTGAIGFGSAKIRSMIVKDLDILKKTKILAIKPDEESAIAQKLYEKHPVV